VSVVENNSESLNQIRKSSISVLLSKDAIEIIKELLYHKNETESQDRNHKST